MSGKITVVGLGPGDPSLRTLGTQHALGNATRIVLRTRVHPGIEDVLDDPRVSSCDDLYEKLSDFERVYQAIAERVIDVARNGDVVFAVPGHPLFGERSVQVILKRAQETKIDTQVLDAVSAIDTIVTALGFDPLSDEVQILDGESLQEIWEIEPFSGGQLAVDPTRPCLITQLYSKRIASHAKLALAHLYPEDHEIKVISASGIPGVETEIRCRLHELDHQKIDHLTSAYVPALPELGSFKTASAVERIVARLRAPGGCPWDRKQDHKSLRGAVLEEAYEVVDAIDEDDPFQLAEELGDLFLLIAMHSQIAHESAAFSLEDVFEQVSRKLIRRHPHVFGDAVAETPDQVVTTWEGVKKAERSDRGHREVSHPYDRLPKSMPVLTKLSEVMKMSTQIQETEGRSRDDLGTTLFDAVRAMISAGLDPEQELERMARQRFDPSEVRDDRLESERT